MLFRSIGEYLFETLAGEYYGIYSEKEIYLRMPYGEIIESNMSDFIFNVNVGNLHEIMLFKDDKMQYNFACSQQIYGNEKCLNVDHNTHIIWNKNGDTFQVRCFERGVGETQACGSGAYAVGIAMMQHFDLQEVFIEMKGGRYQVKKNKLIVSL